MDHYTVHELADCGAEGKACSEQKGSDTEGSKMRGTVPSGLPFALDRTQVSQVQINARLLLPTSRPLAVAFL